MENFVKLIHSWTINWAACPSQIVTETVLQYKQFIYMPNAFYVFLILYWILMQGIGKALESTFNFDHVWHP